MPEITFEELAFRQGVAPIEDVEMFRGWRWDGDETEEEFAAMLREWRSEGALR